MRVLHIMLSEGLGGLESAFTHYTSALKYAGCEVICCTTPHAKIIPFLDNTIPLCPLSYTSEYDPRSLWGAWQLIKTKKPDAIITHGRRGLSIFSTIKCLMGDNTPIINVLHGPRFKQSSRANHTITVSQALRTELIRRGMADKQVTYIPNFITSAPLPYTEKTFSNPPVIGALGRFVNVKGIDIFIEALSLLKQRGLAFRAKIAGAGQDETTLKSLATSLQLVEHIEWLGWVDNPTSFYQDIDIFCLPSRAESFGLALLDAMSHGKPVISTKTSGPMELITPAKNGLLCEISAESIANTLQQVLTQPGLAHSLGENAHKASGAYNLDAIAPRIKACITQIIAETAARH